MEQFYNETLSELETAIIEMEIEANYRQVKADIVHIVESEMERIRKDPDLQHLTQQE